MRRLKAVWMWVRRNLGAILNWIAAAGGIWFLMCLFDERQVDVGSRANTVVVLLTAAVAGHYLWETHRLRVATDRQKLPVLVPTFERYYKVSGDFVSPAIVLRNLGGGAAINVRVDIHLVQPPCVLRTDIACSSPGGAAWIVQFLDFPKSHTSDSHREIAEQWTRIYSKLEGLTVFVQATDPITRELRGPWLWRWDYTDFLLVDDHDSIVGDEEWRRWFPDTESAEQTTSNE